MTSQNEGSAKLGNDILPLTKIHYDPHARGIWCRAPYHGHPKGCPNFPVCIQYRVDFREIRGVYQWFAVIERFDLKAHAEKMKIKHPEWSDRRCRSPLYWQGGVRKRLKEKAKTFGCNILLDIPEACGIEVFETMKEIGIFLERKPNNVIKVMLAGRALS